MFEATDPSTRQPRVLVVDDEPQVLVALRDLLEEDFDVQATDQPEHALRITEEDPSIAVVMSDQRMPRMSGDELLARMRHHSNATRILCTGYADLQAVVRSVNEGRIFAYVTKPWDGVDLRLKMQHAAAHFRLHHELAYEKQLLSDLMNSVPDVIFFKDLERRYIRVNPAFLDLLGATDMESVLGKRLTDLWPEQATPGEIEAIEREILQSGEPRRDMSYFSASSGRRHTFSTTRAAVRSPEGKVLGLVGIAQDVTESVKTQEALRLSEERLRHDEVTGLPNRALFATELGRKLAWCQARQERLALVALDIVRFRHVNETLGRRGGDELLREVARRLAAVARPSDLIARFDSNVFMVMMSGVEQELDAAQWIEQSVIPMFEQPLSVQGTELSLSTKAGIALYPSDGGAEDVLIANAEAALKQAKHGALPYLFYAPSMNSRVAEKLRLETRLRRALTNDEFLLFYQPKIDLKSGQMVGMEALIRWRDPEEGLVSPGSFIPVLEETELILPVGRWVIERAALQYVEWLKRGGPVPRIAVNVSALQLVQRDFVAQLDATLARYPEAAGGLDLEITESVLMDDLAGNIEKLRAAKERGLHVAIDDFGTGYSSLGYLSRLPLDALKIDRSFIDDMADDPQQMSIVTAIISLAHSIEIEVIAEGVETPTQAQLLRLLRCDQIQGYLLARPQPAQDVVKLLGHRFDIPKPQKG